MIDSHHWSNFTSVAFFSYLIIFVVCGYHEFRHVNHVYTQHFGHCKPVYLECAQNRYVEFIVCFDA